MFSGVITTTLCLGFFTVASAFECSSEQTQISSPLLYKEGTDCGTLIGEIVDFYDDAYLGECQRWLGLSAKPHAVGDAYIDECSQFPNGTTRYRSKICCEGTVTTQRCMTCVDVPASGPYTENCNHYRTVETCKPGQVCLTQYNHRNVSKTNTCSIGRFLTKTCVDEDICDALATNNSMTCKNHVNPVTCSYCCSGPFCNYNTQGIINYTPCPPAPYCHYGGKVVTNTSLTLGYHCICHPGRPGTHCQSNYCNCKNGGYCTVTATSPYYYQCDCPIGWTGQNCTIALDMCSSTYCMNGGTCYDHGKYGLRCKCPPGFVGAKCEIKTLECKIPSLYYSSSVYSARSSLNCTQEYDSRKALTTNYIGHCNRWGWNKFGTVSKVPAIGTKTCAKGDVRYFATFEQCCPACYANPCQNGGWCVELENQDHICKCRYGFEGKNCENKVAVCFASGDPHFRTFDGQMLHFQGQCMYSLAANNQSGDSSLQDFQINIQTEHRGDDEIFTYTKYIIVHVFGYKVKLDRGKKVYVDDSLITVPKTYPGFKIIFNGKYVRLETNFSVSVENDGEWTTFVKVPPQYLGLMSGICGNFDANIENEYTTSNGKDVSGDKENRDWEFASSWQVSNPENGEKCESIKPVIPKCDDRMKKLVASKMICGLIKETTGPFETCLAKQVSFREDFYVSCHYDSCAMSANATKMKAASCRNLAVLADSCEQKGFLLDWREIANCPLDCKGNSTYVRKGSACPATCQNPTAPETCTLPNTETCACPEGTYLQGEECVEEWECGCHYEGKNYLIGEEWVTEDCRQMNCTQCFGDDCQGWAGVIEELTGACGSDEKCADGECVPICSYEFKESDCENCTMIDNQVGYLVQPCNCSVYVQCEKMGNRWQGFERDCAPCTCWNQESVTCERTSENCTLDVEFEAENATLYGDFCVKGESTFEIHMDETKFYQWTEYSRVEMACPCGTVFDLFDTCGCVHSDYANDCKTPDEVTCLSFDSGWNGFGTTNWVWVSSGGVTIESNDCVKGSCGYFDGNSKLEIPFFTNAYSSYPEISISFWYKRNDSYGEQGLVSNTVCNKEHSILVSSEDADLIGGGIKTQGNDFVGVSGLEAYDGVWHHVVLSYDGSQMDLYVDTVKQNSTSTSGFLENSQCPLVFGHMAEGNFFTGYMDEICIYKKGLSAQQVSTLYYTAHMGVRWNWHFWK